MKIVIEYTIVVSMLSNLLVLFLCEKIVKKQARLKFLSALIGSIIDVIYPLFHIQGIFRVLLLIFNLCLITLISFKYLKFLLFLRDFFLIFILTCVFGGMCDAIRNLIGQFSLAVVCLICLSGYLICVGVLKSISKANKIKAFSYTLTIIDGDKKVEEEGYLDSGNILKDNVTNKPIMLITFDVFSKLYDKVNYISALTKTYDYKQFKNGHFVPVSSVGGTGKILVFTVDEVKVGEDKSFKDVMLGLSFSGFEKSFGKNVLLNYEMI